MRIAVAAIVKDEVDSILEWVAFHRKLGVDRFFIADNGSSDGTYELLKSLERLGWLWVIQFPSVATPGFSAQTAAYERILRDYGEQAEFVAFIDADEFLMPLSETVDFRDFVFERFVDESVSAVGLNWACFGSNNLLFKEEGLVLERFSRCAPARFSPNHHYKSIVRSSRCDTFLNPHHANINSGRYVDALGVDLILHERHGFGLTSEVLWSGVRLNHYVVKSAEEFITLKSRRGSAAKFDRVKREKYFRLHDRNDEPAEHALTYVEGVKKELAEINGELSALGSDDPLISRPWRLFKFLK